MSFEDWKAAVNKCLTLIGHTIEQCKPPEGFVERLWKAGETPGWSARELARMAAVGRKTAASGVGFWCKGSP